MGRPYFLWDAPHMTLDDFRRELASHDRGLRAYWVGKLMRQAKPDDVFTFVTREEIGGLWPALQPYLGRTKPFWTWLLGRWGVIDG